MRVRVSFGAMINGRWPMIRDCFIMFALEHIQEIIDRPTIYRITGGYMKVLTIYQLTEREADIVYNLLHREIDGKVVLSVKKIRSSGEIIPAGYIFAAPEFTEKEKKKIEDINENCPEESKVYKVIKAVVYSTFDAMYD